MQQASTREVHVVLEVPIEVKEGMHTGFTFNWQINNTSPSYVSIELAHISFKLQFWLFFRFA